jgi:hypothetical protein
MNLWKKEGATYYGSLIAKFDFAVATAENLDEKY